MRASRSTLYPLVVVRTSSVFSPGCIGFRTPLPFAACFKQCLYPPFALTASALALRAPRCKQCEHRQRAAALHADSTCVEYTRTHGWTRPDQQQSQFMVTYDALHVGKLASFRAWSLLYGRDVRWLTRYGYRKECNYTTLDLRRKKSSTQMNLLIYVYRWAEERTSGPVGGSVDSPRTRFVSVRP